MVLFAPLWLVLTMRFVSPLSGPCEQSILDKRYILSCKGKFLDRVPELQIDGTIYDELTLADNRITRLEDASFAGVRMKRLDLKGNPLIFIAPGAFQGLGDVLETLILTFDPSLSEFPAESFRLLPKLFALDVTKHGFRSVSATDFDGFERIETLVLQQGALSAVSFDIVTLKNLDVRSNELTAVPTEALSRLSALRSLNLAQNKISSLPSRSFRNLGLVTLDLSSQVVSSVDEGAFLGLESTLTTLALASLSLNSQQLRALRRLVNLTDLDLSRNRITHLDGLFVDMTSLRRLNLQDNPIVALNGDVFRYGASIVDLILANNNISTMDPNSFTGLTSLELLDLENSRGLTLDANTFRAQRNTLKSLKLQNSNLPDWSAIEHLTELQNLFLTNCGIRNIPDRVFQNMKKLRSVDLKNNFIETLTPDSFSGLESSLEILNLLGNQIQTIDGCVFRGFDRINLFQLSLQQNPLRCDCGLDWLYRWFANVTENNNYYKTRISWSCADLNNTLFRDLDDSHFAACDRVPCHVTAQTTLAAEEAGSTEPPERTVEILAFKVVNATHETLVLTWEVNATESVDGFTITCERASGEDRIVRNLNGEDRSFQFDGLTSSTTYTVCLKIQRVIIISCLNSTTSSDFVRLALIYGISAGVGVSLFVLLLIVVCCCCCVTPRSRDRRRGGKDHVIGAATDEPKLGNNTKRFQKPAPVSPPCQGSTVDLQKSRSIAEQLECLTDEERYRLINLLTHSGGSAASLDFSLNRTLPRQRLAGPGPGYVTPSSAGPAMAGCTLPFDYRYCPAPELAKHDYEYIKDDEFYDEISMEEVIV